MTMNKPVRAALWVLAMGLVVSCAALFSNRGKVGQDRIKMPHARHALAKVDCVACHEPVYEAEKLGGPAFPPEGKCLECHRKEKEAGRCDFCHTDVRLAVARTPHPSDLHMSHAKHIDLVKEDCSRCHVQLPEPSRPPARTTTMDTCRSCHQHEKEFTDGRCSECHTDLSRYPLAPITAFSHQGDFTAGHRLAARAAPESCATCHDQRYCADCHASTTGMLIETRQPDRVDRRFIHRNDFLSQHAFEAKAEPATCRRCHASSFCADCHTTQNLTLLAVNPRNPHPVEWSFPGPANTHAQAARQNIGSCAACHDQGAASVCVKCHKVGGVGGNPHPPGWDRRHPMSEIQQNSMCIACHL
jgi:Cytochrome c7 and related cytochrome c